MESRWDQLPDELQHLIMQHRAASTIQGMWLRYTHYAHTHDFPLWHMVRRNMSRYSNWRRLAMYPGVRREWRSELSSWMLVDEDVLHTIYVESELGLWGPRSLRFGDERA